MGLKELFSKLFKIDGKDSEIVRNFLLFVLFYGILLNFVGFSVLRLPFNFYSWAGYGLAIWFIESKVIKLLRSLWFR
jgi:hypothetical protein